MRQMKRVKTARRPEAQEGAYARSINFSSAYDEVERQKVREEKIESYTRMFAQLQRAMRSHQEDEAVSTDEIQFHTPIKTQVAPLTPSHNIKGSHTTFIPPEGTPSKVKKSLTIDFMMNNAVKAQQPGDVDKKVFDPVLERWITPSCWGTYNRNGSEGDENNKRGTKRGRDNNDFISRLIASEYDENDDPEYWMPNFTNP